VPTYPEKEKQAFTMSFTIDAQRILASMYIEVVSERFAKVGAVLRAKHLLVNTSATKSRRPTDEINDALEKMIEKLSNEETLLLAEMDAKLLDVMWRARKYGGIVSVNAVDEAAKTGDRFAEVIQRFCRLNMTSETLQRLLAYAFVWPSLTTHPTNPTSLQYTRAGLYLDNLLADPHCPRHRLKEALQTIRDTPMDHDVADGGRKLERKEPALEADELIAICDVIYNSVCKPHTKLRDALDRFGYRDVKIPSKILDLNVWGAGDGDGNPNVTAAILEEMVLKLRRSIKQHYAKDLSQIIQELEEVQPIRHDGQDIETFASRKRRAAEAAHDFLRVVTAERSSSAYMELCDAAQKMKQEFLASGIVTVHHLATSRIAKMFSDLVIKVQSFGDRFTGIDVRHNSVDLMETYSSIEKVLFNNAKFPALTQEEQEALLRERLLSHQDFVSLACESLPQDPVALEHVLGSNVAARVFSRLRVMAKYVGTFGKLIIAETRSAVNALAALQLLRLSGNIVSTAGATVSIVPLFESREDLEGIPKTVHKLLTEPLFLRHVECIGYFLVMIAKSDTTRLSGPGVTGCQETAISRLLTLNAASYGNFHMSVFIGGGDDQMRGGGRIVETSHTVMLGASRMGSKTPARVAMTIQGLQMQLIFGSSLLSSHFIEAFAAQQLLAAARIVGQHPYRHVPTYCNRKVADSDAKKFFNDCMDNYELIAGRPDGSAAQKQRRACIVEYFSHFPMSLIASANKSSRPLSRKPNPDPLEGRAISLDQLSKHDGAYLTSTLGVAKALKEMNSLLRYGAPEPIDKAAPIPLSPLRHTYLCNKPFRDFVRMQAVVLWQKDFEVAWALRGGRVPPREVRMKLASEYMEAQQRKYPATAQQFLSRIEINDHIEASLLVEALTGRQPASPENVPLTSPLEIGWPDVAASMHHRKLQCALSQLFETKACIEIHKLEKTGGMEPAQGFWRMLGYFGYVGANTKYSTPSFSMTMTDPQKEGNVRVTMSNVEQRIHRPAWMIEPQQSKL
jgi:phosphoenolpyruvate carboxylase